MPSPFRDLPGHSQDPASRPDGETDRAALVALLDALPVPLSVTAIPDQRILFANRAATGRYGLGDGEPPPADSFFAEPAARTRMIADVLRDGVVRDVIVEQHDRTGNRFWSALSASWMVWHGEPAILTVAIDATERQRILAALADSEQRFRDFADIASDWLWEMDDRLRYTYFSSRVEEITGDPPEWHYGKTREELDIRVAGDGEDPLKRRLAYRDVLIGRTNRAGRRIWMRSSAKPRYDATGRFLGYRGTGSDVSGEVTAQAALQESERRFRAIFDNSPAAIFLRDTDLRFVMVNRTYERWFGRPAADVVGRTLRDLFDAGHAALYAEHDRAVLESRTASVREVPTPFADGRVHTTQVHKFPILEADGSLSGIGGIEVDVTSLREAEAGLARAERDAREAEHTMVAALDAADSGIALWDGGLRLVLCNVRYREQAGAAAAMLVPGCLLADYLAASVRRGVLAVPAGAAAEAWIAQRVASAAPEPFELERNGRWLLLRESAAGDGMRLIVTTDITALKDREAALAEAKSAAETANRSKSQFLANMSHELRTPLNAVIGFAEALSEGVAGPLPPRAGEYVLDIRNAGRHLLELIEEVLDLARIEAGRYRLYDEPVDLAELVGEVMRVIATAAGDKPLALDVAMPEPPPALLADRRAVRQMLTNLLSNAVKFTPAGAVRLAVAADGDGLAITVSDTGIGIAARDLARVRQPFEQAETAPSRRHQGTGLGLAIVDRLIRLHGGELVLDSEVGRGTVATLRFGRDRVLPAA